MEKLLCDTAETAISLQAIMRWVVLMLQTSLRSMFLRACLSCSCLSGVHDGVHEHEQQVASVARHLQISGSDDAETTSGKISKEEMEVVLWRMGLRCGHEGEQLEEHMNPDEFSCLFEEEPSLDEVKQAFCIFDEDSDGFIDAVELQRTLSRIGFAEVSLELEACKSMIRMYDTNQDGKLDFMEFLRVMEISLC